MTSTGRGSRPCKDDSVQRDEPNLRFPHLFIVARIDDGLASGPVEERISLVSAYESRDAAERELEIA
jgi:hypothetical protein